jgi:hypothetical protein
MSVFPLLVVQAIQHVPRESQLAIANKLKESESGAPQ